LSAIYEDIYLIVMEILLTVVNVCPLYPHPALLLDGAWNGKRHKYIAISDLHIGFESAMCTKGITIDSSLLLEEMLSEIFDLVKIYHVDGVALLGDLKNTIGYISKDEWERIPKFLKLLSDSVDVYLIPGNHDGNIRLLIPQNVHMISNKGMFLNNDTLLIHGHTMPLKVRPTTKRIVMGHIHPIFQKSGSVIRGQRVWLYLKVKREAIFLSAKGTLDIIVIPTFNKYLFAERHSIKSVSPLLNKAIKDNAIERAMVITLDGSIIEDKIAILGSVI
jgi:uncharacterized protein